MTVKVNLRSALKGTDRTSLMRFLAAIFIFGACSARNSAMAIYQFSSAR